MRPADWFGLCDTEREGCGCRPSIKLSGELVAPGWRNWQTQRTQNPPRATSWGFDPPSRHQDKPIKRRTPLLCAGFLFHEGLFISTTARPHWSFVRLLWMRVQIKECVFYL